MLAIDDGEEGLGVVVINLILSMWLAELATVTNCKYCSSCRYPFTPLHFNSVNRELELQ